MLLSIIGLHAIIDYRDCTPLHGNGKKANLGQVSGTYTTLLARFRDEEMKDYLRMSSWQVVTEILEEV